MTMPARMRFGIWLERFTFLHPILLRYSHEHPEGTYHYTNWVSGTFAGEEHLG